MHFPDCYATISTASAERVRDLKRQRREARGETGESVGFLELHSFARKRKGMLTMNDNRDERDVD